MKRPYLWITLVVLVVYGQVLFFGYTYLDDYTLIVQHSDFFVHPANLFRVFTTDFIASVSGGEYYRPIFTASLILNGIIAGQSPFLFHLTDLLLHLGVCLLLYRFLLNITKSNSASLLGSLVFSVHPLLAQTVAWIPARNDLLAAVFILWYFIAFDQILKNPSVKKYYVYAVLAMALALGSKETAVIIPFVSFLYTWLISENQGRYMTLLQFVPIWAVLGTVWFLGRSAGLPSASEASIATAMSSVYFSLPAVLQYLGKMVFPFDLSTYPVVADLRLIYGFMALTVIAVGILASKYKRYKTLFFGVAWFLGFILLSLVRVKTLPYSEVLEHRAYLPFMGILILMLELDWLKKNWSESRLGSRLFYTVLALLVIINIAHTFSFRNGLAYWEQAVKTSPTSPFAYKQVGAMRHKEGRVSGAEEAYKKVISINPEETLVYNNLGLLYAEQGRHSEAEILYRLEIATNPDFDKTYMNLGNLYWLENRRDEARELWQKTITLNPYFFQAYRNLAIYYYETDQYDEGFKILDQIVGRGGQIDADLLDAYQSYLLEPSNTQ